MAELLKGKAVVDALKLRMQSDIQALAQRGITPTLATLRMGERPDDISYEKGAMKRAKGIGIEIKSFVLDEDAPQSALLNVIDAINEDASIHGALIFRPLPGHIDDEAVRSRLAPQKDVDGITDASMVGVYTGTPKGYPPCTAQACMEILNHYGIPLTGKRAVVIGRSLVVGKPVGQMLMGQNATVTTCHTRTVDMPALCRQAEILIVAAGRPGVVGGDYLSPGQVVIDVGINVNDEGKLTGDVDFESAQALDLAITPVPGGVGTVTTSVLCLHVIEAAKACLKI